jgi:hypothetical protein
VAVTRMVVNGMVADQGHLADRHRTPDHQGPDLVTAPIRGTARGGARAYRAVRDVTCRIDPQRAKRAWTWGHLGVIFAGWGAVIITLILVATGVIG